MKIDVFKVLNKNLKKIRERFGQQTKLKDILQTSQLPRD